MDTELMPPAGIDPAAESDEERRRRLSFMGGTSAMPPGVVGPPKPLSQVASPSSMPPAGLPAAARSEALPVTPAKPIVAPDLGNAQSVMPPASPNLPGADSAQPQKPAMPPMPVGPQMQAYQDAAKQPAPELHGWKKALDVLSQVLPVGRMIEQNIPGSPGNYNAKLNTTAMRAAKEQALTEGEQAVQAAPGKEDLNRRNVESEIASRDAATDKLENPEDKLQDITKEFSDALAKGDQKRIDALAPRVKQYLDATQKPGADKVVNAKEDLQRQIAAADAAGDTAKVKTLQARMKAIDPEGQQRIVINQGNQAEKKTNAKDIASAIIAGDQPPTLTGLRENTAAIRAELARSGFNLARAESDWHATQKHLATMNGAQQERLRQAVSFTTDSLDIIDDLYNQWQKVGKTSQWKAFNKASLETAKQLPGEPGNIAHRLEAQINDLTSELGTVYKGGNSSTDESLKLATGNLHADWNEQTFKDAMKQIRQNLAIRKNSIQHSQAAGVTEGSSYLPPGEATGSAFDKWKSTQKNP